LIWILYLDKFKDIRPYQDHEIRAVLDRLLLNPEFLDSIARFHYPTLTRLFPALMMASARKKLEEQLSGVHDVKSMQAVIAGYMDKMIHDTTTGLTNSGLDLLPGDRNYLFISNHRDIAMDPAFVNYMLYLAGHETLQIAIGDNLLKNPFVTDLMRLNKSFIVRRSLKGRELLQSLSLLSQYIHFSVANRENVWIAQREGRAKDGIDKTDPALLKMLAMGRRDLSLGESLSELNIVPVAISYEYDACDELKAEELHQIEKRGSFTKTEQSDIQSIVAGMIGFKGQVHVAFGTELKLNTDDPDEIAAIIDAQILENYALSDTNFLALEKLKKDGLVSLNLHRSLLERRKFTKQHRKMFEKRLKAIDNELHQKILFGYANPLINKLKTGIEIPS
jgi:1-acyl-sn-glycerol-3-phosphate acyltransferase